MSIKLTPDTIAILENYAAIAKGVILKPGELKTLSKTGASAAAATITEEFPHEVPVHDILNFLNVLGLFNEPIIEFNEAKKFMTITDATDPSRSTRFYYSAPELMKSPKGRIRPSGPEVRFKLTESQLAVLVKATAVLKKPEWAVIAAGKTIKLVTYNSKEPNSNDFSLIVEGDPNGVECTSVFSFENIRLLKGNYDVIVTEQLGQFTNTDRAKSGGELLYWIGVEATTKFNHRGGEAAAGN